ncbi:MAG: histidine triad nucleotide-binding protein [Deltaproteobacteria bacterium]|nr:histidine triad nucleotide-binding protein [Deltaproteobacteria bacterium]
MSDCLFCKIIDGKIPAKRLAESDAAIAIADITPQAPVHALVLPRKHVASLNDLTDADRRAIMPALYELADRLVAEKGLRETGYRTVINNGADGGQTVFHLHMHVLAGAKLNHGFGG